MLTHFIILADIGTDLANTAGRPDCTVRLGRCAAFDSSDHLFSAFVATRFIFFAYKRILSGFWKNAGSASPTVCGER